MHCAQGLPAPALSPSNRTLKPSTSKRRFSQDFHHHRWLLTTCIAGIAATLLIGGVTLGIFGQNAVPVGANAAISSAGEEAGKKILETPNLQTASTGPRQRCCRSANCRVTGPIPKSPTRSCPTEEQETAVLDAEIEAVENENENITTI